MKPKNLKEILYSLVSTNSDIFDWMTEKSMDGLWFFKKNNLDEFWISESFWSSLGSEMKEAHYQLHSLTNQIGIASKSNLQVWLRAMSLQKQETQQYPISFLNASGDCLSFTAEVYQIEDKEKHTYMLISLNKTNLDQHYKTPLKEKVKGLEMLMAIYEETNQIARIGGWEADLINNEIIWTQVTKEIHEVSNDYEPNLTDGINFYKEGWSRDLITELFKNAVENGVPFDAELKIITAKNRELWVRSFGKPEIKNGQCVRVYGAFQDIDEKKKSAIELQQTKNRFEKTFKSSPIGIVLINKKNQFVAVNPASLRIFGFEKHSEEDVLQLSFKDFIHSENIENVINLRTKLISREINSYKVEVKCHHTSGKIIWCSLNSSLIPGSEHTDELIITQVEDITEQKELQRLASENANKFIKAFDNSPNGMGVITLDGQWLMVNKNLYQMLGYTKEQFLALDKKEVVHPDDFKNDTELLRSLINKEIDNYSVEKRFLSKNNKTVHCYLHVAAIDDENGNVNSLIGQVVDMSDQIKAQRALKRSLQDLQGLLDATTQIIIIETNLDHIIKKFNKGAENLLGYTADEIVGKKRPTFFHVAEEMDEYAQTLSEKYGSTILPEDIFTSNVEKGDHESKEWTYIKKDGTTFPVQLVVTAIRNQNGSITGYLGVATDISYLKSMEQSLLASKEKAEMASKSKSEFLANMSHEIRTPLNGVIGFTDLLMNTQLTDSQQNYMDTVYTSAISLLDLINDVLDFSKIEAGKLELHEERLDLKKLCGQAIDLVKHQAHKKNLEVLINISPKINCFIYADAVRLKQVITNLLANAVKFTHEGEIELKVQPKTHEKHDGKINYMFSIRDTGIGIAPENINKIFFAFDQEDGSTTRKYGGSGLGLTISNSLLGMMGSKLMVESKLGLGSVFFFEVFFRTESVPPQQKTYKNTIKSVLIVDDNVNNRTILKNMLDIEHIDSTLVSNGVEAIDILEKDTSFDLAIIDYHMPYLNGLDLIRHIRQELKLNSDTLPILFLHSFGDDEKVIKNCKELDIQFNRVKPIQLNVLFDLLAKIGKVDDSYLKTFQKPTKDLENYDFKILVAEDNPVNKYLVRTIITKLLPKSEIIEVSNGQEAIDAYKTREVDLIFMDIQMPILSGFQATQEIRNIEKNKKRVPIIALTARILKGEHQRCIDFGMDDYITKPVVLETFRKVIIDYLIPDEKEPPKNKLNPKSNA